MQRTIEARAGRPATPTQLVSTYFDTADHQLASRKLVLRVREEAGHYKQTVKSENNADPEGPAAFSRGEWEDPVPTMAPDPNAPESGRFIEPDITGRLIPIFRSEVERRTLLLEPEPETRIEVALDRGRLHAIVRGEDEPISEVELELKQGSVLALYDVALDLLAIAPMRLELRSKAERGYLLAENNTAPIEAVHATLLRLDPSLSGNEALRRIGIACLMQIARNEPAVLAGLGDGIHQMRVAVRRLRAILSAFSHFLPEAERRALSDELHWLADALGSARNLDAFKTSLLKPAQQALADADGLDQLAAAAEHERRMAFAKAGRTVRSTRYTRLLLRQFRWFEGCLWQGAEEAQALQHPIGAIAARVLEKRLKAAKRRSKGLGRQSAEERHRLRIALKKLRYATEMLSGLYESGDVARFTKKLKKLQSHLGDANDVRVAHSLVGALAKPRPDPTAIAGAGEAVLQWHEHRLAQREPKLRKQVRRLIEADPFWSEPQVSPV